VNIKRIAAAFFAAVLLATWAWADGEEVGAGADAKQLDERIYKVLRDVINTGAERYNKPNNDPEGCYRIYQGSLLTLKPLMTHRPGLQ